MYGLRSIVATTKSFFRRFDGRLDSEHEQAFIRIGIGTIVLLYFLVIALSSDIETQNFQLSFVWVMAAFIVASIGIIVHIAYFPQILPPRRLLAAVLDSGAVTYFFFNADEHALPLYFLYLWIIFGYGFRYGRKYLLFILALSLVGFGAAVLTLPYWGKNQFLGIGLWVGMLFVSMYVNKLIGRLTAALKHAEAANQAKRSFISSVSHELRTPLNAIIGMADLLRSTKLNAEQADMVHSMDNASNLMLSLIEDVLDFSKIEAGKLVIENIEFDLHHLINNIVDIFKYQASARGLNLLAKIQPDVPFSLRGDPHHLRQVLVNLLSNAVKFTEKGRIILRIEMLSDSEQSVQLRFSVEDTGIGISEEAQAKVFDSFTQADDSTTRRYGGTGLGTTISQQLVELMGGRLGLHSMLGFGSTFWFELCLQKQERTGEQLKFTGLHTLLIGFDDEEACAISVMLDGWGVPNQLASNLNSALDKMEVAAARGKPFQLALLDGWRVRIDKQDNDSCISFFQGAVRELHKASKNSSLGVILCGSSVLTDKDGRQHAEEVGLSALLDVPIEKKLLFNALHAVSVSRVAVPANAVVSIAQSNKDVQQSGKSYTVLVAEDNPTNQKVISKILERAGHRCVLANNGEEALDKLDRQEFDVIVLDMNMPLMTGVEAAKTYQFMCPNNADRLPLIMLSADVTKEARAEAIDAGISEFLSKPIQVKQFLETLDRLVAERDTTQKSRTSIKFTSPPTVLLQPQDRDVILNYATLAELDSIGQDTVFVDGLITGFLQDSQNLVKQLEESLLTQRFEEFKDVLHAMKGSALSIGASSLRVMCQRLEKMTHSELKRDAKDVSVVIQTTFTQLYAALDLYRIQRQKHSASHRS